MMRCCGSTRIRCFGLVNESSRIDQTKGMVLLVVPMRAQYGLIDALASDTVTDQLSDIDVAEGWRSAHCCIIAVDTGWPMVHVSNRLRSSRCLMCQDIEQLDDACDATSHTGDRPTETGSSVDHVISALADIELDVDQVTLISFGVMA